MQPVNDFIKENPWWSLLILLQIICAFHLWHWGLYINKENGIKRQFDRSLFAPFYKAALLIGFTFLPIIPIACSVYVVFGMKKSAAGIL